MLGLLCFILIAALAIALILCIAICLDEEAEETENQYESIHASKSLEEQKAQVVKEASDASLRLNLMAMAAEQQLMDAARRHASSGTGSQSQNWD
jgi:uncharacterized protein YpmS